MNIYILKILLKSFIMIKYEMNDKYCLLLFIKFD